MYTSSDSLKKCSFPELQKFANPRQPTLRQVHALEEMARRAIDDDGLLPTVVNTVMQYLGHEAMMGGLPVGYPAAALLLRAEGRAHQFILEALAARPPQERDDVLRWIAPKVSETTTAKSALAIERDLLISISVESEALASLISDLTSENAPVDLLPLAGHPSAMTMAMVTLTRQGWALLEQRASELASRLAATVFLLPPESLGSLHPDLRVAVHPDGRRELVVAESGGESYTIRSYER